jgi:3-dehydroquinate synthase
MTSPSASKPDLPSHRKVHVDLGPRSYDVLIGRDLIGSLKPLIKSLNLNGTPIVIADEKIQDTAWFKKFRAPRVGEIAFNYVLPTKLPGGEDAKSLAFYSMIMRDLAADKHHRSDIIVALGGGVIGDLAGFVAATYLRGINFVQVPTTLLAMVDSSVGGKTGVNLPEGKNLVGAFHQPKLVVADLDTLGTLPPREFAAGMAEVIKYGAIKDKALFDRVAKGVQPDDDDLAEIIEKCVAIKARIVERDEFEEKGLRALLNFGHTIGHAIEKATGYTKYLHGEAISLGMRAAAWLSHWESGLSLAEVHALEKALLANGLPVHLDEPDDSNAIILTDVILKALGNDKKVASDGKNRWVLLKSLGKAETGIEIDSKQVEAALNKLLVHVEAK